MTISPDIAIIGAGPAGLFAAERLAGHGVRVTVYDRMASPARKFLFAGRGGLNLTHSEPVEAMLGRYGPAAARLAPALAAFPPAALIDWATGLGETPFVGTSGRVFPRSFKATPLLRAWLRRLDGLGVSFAMQHCWTGWQDGALSFDTPTGPLRITPRITLLALGGASWPRLGSNGAWMANMLAEHIPTMPFAASNVGLSMSWTALFAEQFHGHPLKGCLFRVGDATSRGEAVITRRGLEGGAIYALSPALRDGVAAGDCRLLLDLKPDLAEDDLRVRLSRAKTSETTSNILRKHANLSQVSIGLMRESFGKALPKTPEALAAAIKSLPLPVAGLQPIDRAISTAGGIAFSGIDETMMLTAKPGVFIAGEMLDYDAPTGGYLLQACFSTGFLAAEGMLRRLTSA